MGQRRHSSRRRDTLCLTAAIESVSLIIDFEGKDSEFETKLDNATNKKECVLVLNRRLLHDRLVLLSGKAKDAEDFENSPPSQLS